MRPVVCFVILVAVLAGAYLRGRYVEKSRSWEQMRSVGRELHEVAKRCEEQAQAGEKVECDEEWMKGAIWTLQRWKEGVW